MLGNNYVYLTKYEDDINEWQSKKPNADISIFLEF